MDPITPRQQAIYDFVARHLAERGMPATLGEIAQAFGFNQARAAHKHLLALQGKGWLTLLPGKARGIRLNRPRADDGNGLRLPVLGRVAAGAPIGAAAEVEREVLLDPRLFHPRPDYLLRVQGDSMRDDGILDGDLVAVHRTAEARTGQTVVARLEGEITIKRLELGPKLLRLLPRNAAHAPITVMPDTTDFAIEGLFAGLLRCP